MVILVAVLMTHSAGFRHGSLNADAHDDNDDGNGHGVVPDALRFYFFTS